MFYKFNKNTLTFDRVNWVKMLLKYISITALVFIIALTNMGLNNQRPITNLTEKEIIVINRNSDVFTPEKLQAEIKKLNFRFPYIVYAQSMVETGGWTSQIYKENHNLFGMKEAVIRSNVAAGTNRSHAYYNNWRESVMDYALYYATYLHSLQTEDDYFVYLDSRYALDGKYVSSLKRIIKENNLKELFAN